jgi:hypothetical protein
VVGSIPDPEPDEDCVWLVVGADSLPLPLPLPEPVPDPVCLVAPELVVEIGVYVLYEVLVVLEAPEDEK